MLKKIVYIVLALVGLVLLAGFVKFNFSDDDIYVQNTQGDWVSLGKQDASKHEK